MLGLRRKKWTLIKAVIAVPVLYFSVIGFVMTISGRGIPEVRLGDDDESSLHRRDLQQVLGGGGGAAPDAAELKNWDAKFHNPDNNPGAAQRIRTKAPPVAPRDPLIPPVDLHVEHDDHVAEQIRENDRRRKQMRRDGKLTYNAAAPADAAAAADGAGAGGGGFKVTHPPDYRADAPGESQRVSDVSVWL